MFSTRSTPIFSKGFSIIELIVSLLLIAIVGLILQNTILKSSGSFKKATIQSTMDKEHFLALQKIRQTGALKSAIQNSMDGSLPPGTPSEYAKLVDCLEGVGSNCMSFNQQRIELGNNSTLKSTVSSDMTNCPPGVSCNSVFSRDTYAIIDCNSQNTCTGLRLHIVSDPNNDQIRKLSSTSPINERSLGIEISSSELIKPGLKGICPNGTVEAINKATNKIECGSAEANASLADLNNICRESFDATLGEAYVGVKNAGLNASICQKIKLAKWNEASAWPAPKSLPPPISIEEPLLDGIKTENEVPIVGDLYLVVDTSESMAPYRKKVAEGIADIVQQTRSNPNNSINIYLYPVTALDGEAISNSVQTSTSNIPNSNRKLYYTENILKPPFVQILSGQTIDRSELINKIENAPTPYTDWMGNSNESGTCALIRLLTKEQETREKAGTISEEEKKRRKFFLFLTDERDIFDEAGGLSIRFIANSSCSHSFKEEWEPKIIAEKSETRYAMPDGTWHHINEIGNYKPSNADRKAFASYGAFTVFHYKLKSVSEDKKSPSNPDGVVEHDTYTYGPWIIPKEYGLQDIPVNANVNCPEDLKNDVFKYTESVVRKIRNQNNYYTTEARKNEKVILYNCQVMPYGLGYYPYFDATSFASKEDFFNFNLYTQSGTDIDGKTYTNMADYLAKDRNGLVVTQLNTRGATKDMMRNSDETSDFYHYDWLRDKTVPINLSGGPQIEDFLLNKGKWVSYYYSYIHKEPSWTQWLTVFDTRVWTSAVQYFLNRMPDESGKVQNAYTSDTKISDIVRKSFDYVYGENYAVTGIIPKINSSCVDASKRYSPLYNDIIGALPSGRKSIVDICASSSEYVELFQKVLDFFSFDRRWDVKSWTYNFQITAADKIQQIEDYFKDNPEAKVVVILYDDEYNEEYLTEGVDYKSTRQRDSDDLLNIQIEFIKNDKNKQRLLKFKKIRLSFS